MSSPASTAPRPRRSRRSPALRTSVRRWLRLALLFCTAALVLNALVGERGLTTLVRARREQDVAAAALASARQRNALLRDEVARLRSDAATIEEAARRDLGLSREGEVVFFVKDAPAKAPR